MYGSERKRRATIGLALFRGAIGVLLVALPWLIGNGLDGYGKTEVACGVAVVAVAALMHRALWLRWVQALLAVLVFFLPFAFGEDVVSDHQIYCAVLAGKLLLLTAIVSPRLFASDETTASDSERSSASNTSSVSTPSK
jgi:hypothetical protein